MSKKIQIEGSASNIKFYNESTFYCIFTITLDKPNENFDISEEITCTGKIPNLKEGEFLTLQGVVIIHKLYGKQFNIYNYEKSLPTTESSIEKYLSSGLIKGIGEKKAKKIVDKFGTQTIDIIETDPIRLSEIKGITKKLALKIGDAFTKEHDLRNAILFLQNYDISPALAIKIYTYYENELYFIIENNPYDLTENIYGVGFKIADKIAESIGISFNSPFRIKCCIKFILNESANLNGDVYLPKDILIKRCSDLLLLDNILIENELLDMQMERFIVIERYEDDILIFLNLYYYAENFVANKLLQLSLYKTNLNLNVDKEIELLENKNNITFAIEQKAAIKNALLHSLLVITGGPGTGKTTIINAIIELLRKNNHKISLCAPTGKAAKRMTESTGFEAQTIHRFLGLNFVSDNANTTVDEIDADVIIVDESSMIDLLLMQNLLKVIPNKTKLILVGDVDQLPSVGAGNVLKDIIQSECIFVTKLNAIFRQAKQSAIITNAHKINNGEYPLLNEKNKDFFFINKNNVNDINNTITELFHKRLPKYLGTSNIKDIQVLCPMRKSPSGTIALNALIQNVVNPYSNDLKEVEFGSTIFRTGDKVMQIKNNYNTIWRLYKNNAFLESGTGIFNGDEGIIKFIDKNSLTVVFDEVKHVEYNFTKLDELILSYAITIHKSQGSEYKAVIIPSFKGPPMLLTRNLLYTAITRAKNLAVIIGTKTSLYAMVDNDFQSSRYTALKHKIINFKSFM